MGEANPMDAKVTLLKRMTFDATASYSNWHVILDTVPEVGGDERGFQPMELMLISLLGCTAMDVISILRKKRQVVTDFEVKGHAERAPKHPKVFTEVTIEYHVTGKNVDEAAVRRSIELSAIRYCPAQGMLAKVVPIRLLYFIYEDSPTGVELVTQGEYVRPEDQ